jgi:hypothetical protein
MLRAIGVALIAISSAGCATYNYAQNVKMISFSDDLHHGHGVGPVHGEDCTWQILGYPLGGMPTVDRAFQHAQFGTDGSSLSGSLDSHQKHDGALRYINNVSTKPAGFNVGLFGKYCIAVTGVGYK